MAEHPNRHLFEPGWEPPERPSRTAGAAAVIVTALLIVALAAAAGFYGWVFIDSAWLGGLR